MANHSHSPYFWGSVVREYSGRRADPIPEISITYRLQRPSGQLIGSDGAVTAASRARSAKQHDGRDQNGNPSIHEGTGALRSLPPFAQSYADHVREQQPDRQA